MFRRAGNVHAVTNMQGSHDLPNEFLQPGPVEVERRQSHEHARYVIIFVVVVVVDLFFCLTFTFVVSVVFGCSGVQGTWTQSRTCKPRMLYQTSAFIQDLSKWNVGKVTSIHVRYVIIFVVVVVD